MSGSILMVNLVLLPLMNVILHTKIVLQYTILPLDWGIWVLIIGVYVCLITGIVLWSGRKKMK